MELRQLRYAVAVADHLNFREASRALHVAQPSLKDASEHVDHAFLRTENIIESSVSRRHVTFSQQLQVQEADHPQEIESLVQIARDGLLSSKIDQAWDKAAISVPMDRRGKAHH